METNKIELNVLFLSLLVIVSIESATALMALKSRYFPMATLGAVRLFETALIFLIVIIRGKGLSSIGLSPSKMVSGLKKGLIWSAVTGLGTAAAFALLLAIGIDPLKLISVQIPAKKQAMVLFFCIGGVVGPIAEEVFFRGVVYGFFRKWGVGVAIVLSTLIFVLAHFRLSVLPLPQLAGGILFAAAYETEGSLMAPITIHVLGNLTIFTISLIAL